MDSSYKTTILGVVTHLPNPPVKAMSFAQERILFTLSWLGAISGSFGGLAVSQEEQRWFFVTCIVAFATSGFLTLGLKGDKETIRVILGRSGIALLTGVFATWPVVDYFNIESAHTSMISLGGICSLTTSVGFVFGLAILEAVIKRRSAYIDKALKKYLVIDDKK